MSDQNAKPTPSAGLPENVATLIAYLFSWLGGLIMLLAVAGDNKNLKFHSIQSIILGIVIVVVAIALNIIIAIIPFLWFLSPIFSLAILVACVGMAVLGYQGKAPELPVIGPMARTYADK